MTKEWPTLQGLIPRLVTHYPSPRESHGLGRNPTRGEALPRTSIHDEWIVRVEPTVPVTFIPEEPLRGGMARFVEGRTANGRAAGGRVPRHVRLFWNLERLRIRAHLRSVERRLRREDTAHFPGAARRARARYLNLLHEYWVRGDFPRNTFVRATVPILVDARGTCCAVAHLMARSGAASTVRELAQRDNHVRLRDVQGGPVAAWLEGAGLKQAEAAAIQPAYSPALDLSIFVTVLFVTLLPFRLIGEALLGVVRLRPQLAVVARLASAGVAVVASVGLAMAATVAGSPTYGDPFAVSFRTALLAVSLGILLPLELGFAAVVHTRFATPTWRRLGATVGLAAASLLVVSVLGPLLVWPLSQTVR